MTWSVQEAKARFSELLDATIKMVGSNWLGIERVARALLRHRQLSGDFVRWMVLEA